MEYEALHGGLSLTVSVIKDSHSNEIKLFLTRQCLLLEIIQQKINSTVSDTLADDPCPSMAILSSAQQLQKLPKYFHEWHIAVSFCYI